MNPDIPLRWHRRYRIFDVENGILFIGEKESYFLKGALYVELLPKINSSSSGQDALSLFRNFQDQLAALNGIESLLRQGFIEEIGGDDESIFFVRPDFKKEPFALPSESNQPKVTILSQCLPQDEWISSFKQFQSRLPDTIIVDDYLDPRLEEINQHYMKSGTPWLLIKPMGEKPLIGPYFRPSVDDSPCRGCLADRMLHNQPVRRWRQSSRDGNTISIPLPVDRSQVKSRIETVLKIAVDLVKRTKEHQKYFLKTIDPPESRHIIFRRPQCSYCGDPDMMEKQADQPIQIQTGIKRFNADGGFRMIHPHETIQRLLPFVSPITGIMCDAGKLPDQPKVGVQIFRSSFFKTPGVHECLSENDFIQYSLGKGISEAQSRAGALAESVERYSARYQGDEAVVWGTPKQLRGRSILPHQLAEFSEQQYAELNIPRYSPHIPLPWTPGYSLTYDEKVYLPVTFCYEIGRASCRERV